MPTRIPPALDYAAYAQEHLRYEARMFAEARDVLLNTRPNGFDKMAAIEVSVLHLRNLIDFFYPSPNMKADDVTAWDYCFDTASSSSDWDTDRPTLSPTLETARKRAHGELAHLTTRRIAGAPSDKAWDLVSLSQDLSPVIESFVNAVDAVDTSRFTPETIIQLRRVGNPHPHKGLPVDVGRSPITTSTGY